MVPTRKTVVFSITERCNFACRYCYVVHKHGGQRMPLAVAQGAVDYLLQNRGLFPEADVDWGFIGGEPLLEVELIGQIIDYVDRRTRELGHPWAERSRFRLSSNGALYGTAAVQALIARHSERLRIGISIDGPRHVHDRQRVLPDGRGTYDQVVANLPLWLEQNPRAFTKVTLAHDTLPFVAESMLHLFALGLKKIHANVVFENCWQPGDDAIFEQQLDLLADALIARGLWRDHECSLFTSTVGQALPPTRDNNWCGPGMMIAVDAEGRFYPCNRFMRASLAKRPARAIGDIHAGLDLNRLRPFLALTRSAQSDARCVSCEVASGCAWCQGLNYDDADTPTIYQRATHLCALHKARARANQRYWARIEALEQREGVRAAGRQPPAGREPPPQADR